MSGVKRVEAMASRSARTATVAGAIVAVVLIVSLALADPAGAATVRHPTGVRHAHRHQAHRRHAARGRGRRAGAGAAAEATKLARSVTRGSVAARYRGLLSIMRALGVNVVSGGGRPLVVVRESRAAGDFALYDFELRGLAQQLRSGVTVTPDVVAGQLVAGVGGKLTVRGRAFDGSMLSSVLDEGARWAVHHPSGAGANTMLLLRALGRAHRGRRYDLARRPKAPTIALDPLQSLLIHLALTMPQLRRLQLRGPGAPQASGGRGHGAVHHRGRRARTASASGMGFCQRIVADENALQNVVVKRLRDVSAKTVYGQLIQFGQGKLQGALATIYTKAMLRQTEIDAGKKAAEELGKGLEKASNAVGEFMASVDALHDVLLATLVQVVVRGGSQQTHWDHGDGATGKPMDFQVVVWMPVDLGRTLVNCGPLVHMQLPAKGPIKGVPVMWFQSAIHNGLLGSVLHPVDTLTDDMLTPAMGSTSCGSLPCMTATGADGVAHLTFTPNREPIPGTGPVLTKKGHLYPTVLYQTAEGGSLFMGQIAQFLFPKGTTAFGFKPPAWEVSYHEVPNFVLSFSATVTPQYPHVDGPFGISFLCDMTIDSEDNSGAITVQGTAPVQLTSDPGVNPTVLEWAPTGTVPLQHTDTSLLTVDHETTSGCSSIGLSDGQHDDHTTIASSYDGTMKVDKVEWRQDVEGSGDPPGVDVVLEVPSAPIEQQYDDLMPQDSPDPQPGWMDAVNQVLLGPLWDGDEEDLAGQRYIIVEGWKRSTDPGVFATDDIDDVGRVDNELIPVAVNVHVHLELRPVARSS